MSEHETQDIEQAGSRPGSSLAAVVSVAVMSIAAIGYFVGIADGVPKPNGLNDVKIAPATTSVAPDPNQKVIDAVAYSEIENSAMGPTKVFQAQPVSLPKVEQYDLFAEVKPSEAEKERSGEIRASRRSFNGAPPIVPHAIEKTNDAACYSCHSGGMKVTGMKASVMSHAYLANCLQCHAPPPPTPFQDQVTEVETSFVGLPAPKAGKRAFPGAPPTIPHSQFMREACNACHGGPNGWAGLESTHPWRTNCTQCHAPSAAMDQMTPATDVPMLPPLVIAKQ